jgi:hypothetical protein
MNKQATTPATELRLLTAWRSGDLKTVASMLGERAAELNAATPAVEPSPAEPEAEPKAAPADAPKATTRQQLDSATVERAHVQDEFDEAERIGIYVVGKLALQGAFTRTMFFSENVCGYEQIINAAVDGVRAGLQAEGIGEYDPRNRKPM